RYLQRRGRDDRADFRPHSVADAGTKPTVERDAAVLRDARRTRRVQWGVRRSDGRRTMEIVGRASRSKRERQAAEAVAREAKKLEEQMSAIEVEWFGAPLHGSDLAKCAVVGITNGTWRN